MYIRALSGYKKALGADHTSTLSTINNLGALYWNQGRLFEAEQMCLRALTGFRKSLGPGHPSTVKVMNRLQQLALGDDRYII